MKEGRKEGMNEWKIMLPHKNTGCKIPLKLFTSKYTQLVYIFVCFLSASAFQRSVAGIQRKARTTWAL